MKLIFFDIEIYPNLFIAVFYDPYVKEYKTFTCWDNEEAQINELLLLKNYLKHNQDVYFVGYNSLAYDMNIVTQIVTKNYTNCKQIKEFNDEIIAAEWPIYKEDQLCNKTIDLMLVNNYGPRSAKSTSLKKLEFNLRKKKIQDLPYHFNDIIDTYKKVEEIIKYCKYDVEVTLDVFRFSKELIKLRIEFGELNNLSILNSPEPDMAKQYIYTELAKSMEIDMKEFKKLKTYHPIIKGKDIILDFINFENEIYKDVLEFYNKLELYPTLKSQVNPSKKVISLKNTVSKTIKYKNLVTVYGSGGIHGFVQPGVYKSNDEYTITSFDFASYYPHLQFVWDCIADHIPSEVYSQLVKDLFKKRKQYPKGTSLNYVFKIFINLLYGLSNSEYSALFDTKATLKTTINGMLILSMIADKIYSQSEDNIILMKNTDGLEIYHKRSNYSEIIKIFDEISQLVNIPYETVEYKKLVGLNVNNYISIDINDNIKTKGCFEDYKDIMKQGAYHKDTSAMIIPLALKEYFINGIPVEETIYKNNNIYDFCYGVKGSSLYSWLVTEYNPTTKVSKSELMNHRFIRYYAGGYQTISKFWLKGKKQDGIDAIEANTPITMLLNVPKEDILDLDRKGEHKSRYDINGNIIYRYPNLNKDWYIAECYKIINQINN
jgi:hypothetical protein